MWSFACLSEDHKSFIPLQSSRKTMSQEYSGQVCAGGGDAKRYVGRVGHTKSRSRASSAILIDGASPAHESDHDKVAQADPNRPQSLSARALLHARAGTEVVREAPKRLI